MIKVIGSSVADIEADLIIAAARFFLDRLLPASQQKKLIMKIDVTDGRPHAYRDQMAGWVKRVFWMEAATPF